MKKNISATVLNTIVLIGIILTFLALIATPLIMTAFFKSGLQITGSNLPIILTICIYIFATPYLISLFALKRLCHIVMDNNPFSKEIPRLLKRISVCSFSVILLYNLMIIGLHFFFDIYLYALTVIPAIVISFIALAIGFLTLVLARLFTLAINIKDENDQTI